jgi:hypothetical protein
MAQRVAIGGILYVVFIRIVTELLPAYTRSMMQSIVADIGVVERSDDALA